MNKRFFSFVPANCREVAITHYSSWALYAICALIIVPDILYRVLGIDTNPIVWGRLLIIAAIGGIVGKFVIQGESNKWRRRSIILLGVSILFAISLPAVAEPADLSFEDRHYNHVVVKITKEFEGDNKRGDLHVSYQDIVGVWTVCYGHTATAVPGQTKTEAQCNALLAEELASYRSDLRVYFTQDTIAARLPVYRDAAFTSFAYNVGVRGAGRSTAVRRLNQGRVRGACDALSWWNKAGGRVVRGLVRRRAKERDYCLRSA